MTKVSKNVSWEIIKKSFLPSAAFLILIASYAIYKIHVVPRIRPELYGDLKKYIATIFVISISFLIQRIISAILSWYKENIAAKTLTKLDDDLIPIFHRTLKVLIWAIALLISLPFYGVNISGFIAVLGVSSLAIAMAAQDTIANIIAGFLLMIDTPFRIGDKIKIPSGEVVTVLDIGIRRSKFLAQDKAIIIVPNLDLSKSKIVNYTYGENRRT